MPKSRIFDEILVGPAFHQEDVVGLQIAVDDARLVGRGEAFSELSRNVQDASHGDRLAVVHYLRERDAVEVLHHEVGRPVRQLAEVADIDDVRIADGGGRLGLVQEPLGHFLVASQVRTQDLHRDLLADDGVATLVDDAHAAFAEDGLDLVATVDGAAEIGILLRHHRLAVGAGDLADVGVDHGVRRHHRDQLQRAVPGYSWAFDCRRGRGAHGAIQRATGLCCAGLAFLLSHRGSEEIYAVLASLTSFTFAFRTGSVARARYWPWVHPGQGASSWGTYLPKQAARRGLAAAFVPAFVRKASTAVLSPL